MKQPLLGIVSSTFVIAFSLAFISLFSFSLLTGWVSYLLQCLIPAQILVTALWQCEPRVKGLVTVLAGVVIAPMLLYTIGGGIAPPTPMLIHFTVVSVVTMFWLSIIWGGWPFNVRIASPLAAGIVTLAACYVLTAVSFRLFLNYDFMRGAPVYVPSLDPHGWFNAWSALTVQVTALVVMFVMLNFDLGPQKQPLRGVVWTAICLAGAFLLFELGTGMAGMDPVIFLTRITIPFIFGTIVVGNMLQNSLFGTLTQPLKGIANTVASAVIGSALAQLYGVLASTVTGQMLSGPPAYEYEIWLATSLLSVTFPFLIFFAEFFRFWPLQKD